MSTLHFHKTSMNHEAHRARTYNNMYARGRGVRLWVERVGLTSLPNSHRVVLDAFDDVWVIEEQFGTVLPFDEGINELKLIRCETEKNVKKLNDNGFCFFKIKPFFFPKYGNQGGPDMTILNRLNRLEGIGVQRCMRATDGKIEKDGLAQCIVLLWLNNSSYNHVIYIIKVTASAALNKGFDLAAKQFQGRECVDCELLEEWDGNVTLLNREHMTTHGIVYLNLDVVTIASGIDVREDPRTERMRRFGGRRDGVALSEHIWNDDAVYLLAFLKHFIAAAIITVVKVNVNGKAWHLEYCKVDGGAAFQDKAVIEKWMALNELENICKTKNFLEIVAKEASLRGKNSKLLSVECWHNRKMLNVVANLRGNIKSPFVDERGALFHGGETGYTTVAMAAADREELIWKMQRVFKKGQDIAYLLIECDFSVTLQVKKQMLCVDILDGREAVKQFLNTTAKINAVNTVDDGPFNIGNTNGAVVVIRQNAIGNGITKVSVAETIKIERRETSVADNGHLVKRLMRKSMKFHGRMIRHGCRRSNGRGYLDLGSLRRRSGKVKHTIEVTPHFDDKATGLVVEQKLCSTLPVSRELHHVFLGEYEFPLQFW